MQYNEEWRPFVWRCSQCGADVTGYKNARGDIKVQCGRCKLVMVRTIKGKRHSTMELYTPKGVETNQFFS